MARINIEDSFWIDIISVAIKFGDQDKAVGNVLRFFRLAQEKHKSGDLISEEEFKSQEFSENLFPIFAERIDGGIQAIGSSKHFGWLRERVLSGKKGGLSKSQEKTKHLKQNRSATEAKQKQIEPSSSSSSSSSVSCSFSKNNIAQTKVRASEFELIYKKYPRKEGKGRGMQLAKKDIRTPEDFALLDSAVDRYREHCKKNSMETKFIKHFGTFMGSWRDWLDPEHGTGQNFKNSSAMLTEEDFA